MIYSDNNNNNKKEIKINVQKQNNITHYTLNKREHTDNESITG